MGRVKSGREEDGSYLGVEGERVRVERLVSEDDRKGERRERGVDCEGR